MSVLSREDPRSTILTAATELLRAEGPTRLTVRNVAFAAGCSTTGVYTWFGGKNELVDAIFVEGFTSFRNALVGATALPGVPALVALGVEYRRWAHAHTTEYQVMFTRPVREHTPSDHAQGVALGAFSVLVDAVESNRSPAHLGVVETDVFACHFWATIHGHVMLDICGLGAEANVGEKSPEDQFVESITAAIRGFQVAAMP